MGKKTSDQFWSKMQRTINAEKSPRGTSQQDVMPAGLIEMMKQVAGQVGAAQGDLECDCPSCTEFREIFAARLLAETQAPPTSLDDRMDVELRERGADGRILVACLDYGQKPVDEFFLIKTPEGDQELSQQVVDIMTERCVQNATWGEQNHTPIEWLAILTEEVGEVAKDTLSIRFGKKPNLAGYRKELVQVAAVALAAIECYDRKIVNDKKANTDRIAMAEAEKELAAIAAEVAEAGAPAAGAASPKAVRASAIIGKPEMTDAEKKAAVAAIQQSMREYIESLNA